MIIIVNFIKIKQRKIVIGFVLMSIIATITTIVCIMRKSIMVVEDGKQIKLITYNTTFDSALKKAGVNIAVKDKVDKILSSKISNNDVININHAINFKVHVDNKVLNITSAEKDMALMLYTEKIVINPNDKVYPSIHSKLSSGQIINITRVKTQVINVKKPIDFKTVIKKEPGTLKTQSKVLQSGIKGEKSITLNVTYENGKEVTRKVVKEEVVKNPQSKILVQGTLSHVSYSRGEYSNTFSTSARSITVKATAYWAVDGVNNTYTFTGRKAVRNSNGYSTIAVDPKIIPLGSRLYVEGYGYAIAADKGSGINGKFIDVFFETRAEASNWGVKYLNVKMLD
jgi:uncharacterized protein YabE (DUF348 family)